MHWGSLCSGDPSAFPYTGRVPGRWGLTFMALQGRVGVANSHQDEEEEERPQQFDQKLDLGENRWEMVGDSRGCRPTRPWPHAGVLPAVSGDTCNSSRAAASAVSRRPW